MAKNAIISWVLTDTPDWGYGAGMNTWALVLVFSGLGIGDPAMMAASNSTIQDYFRTQHDCRVERQKVLSEYLARRSGTVGAACVEVKPLNRQIALQ